MLYFSFLLFSQDNIVYNVSVVYLRCSMKKGSQEDSHLGKINKPLTLNRYNYCISSPLNYQDPSGHWIDLNAVKSEDLIKVIQSNGVYSVAHNINDGKNYIKLANGRATSQLSAEACFYMDLCFYMDFFKDKLVEYSLDYAGITNFSSINDIMHAVAETKLK